MSCVECSWSRSCVERACRLSFSANFSDAGGSRALAGQAREAPRGPRHAAPRWLHSSNYVCLLLIYSFSREIHRPGKKADHRHGNHQDDWRIRQWRMGLRSRSSPVFMRGHRRKRWLSQAMRKFLCRLWCFWFYVKLFCFQLFLSKAWLQIWKWPVGSHVAIFDWYEKQDTYLYWQPNVSMSLLFVTHFFFLAMVASVRFVSDAIWHHYW